MLKNAVFQLRRIPDIFRDYFFPKNCLNCSAEGGWLCEPCRDGLVFIDARPVRSRPAEGAATTALGRSASNGASFCPFCGSIGDMFRVCQKCRTKTGIRKVFSLVKYSDPLARKVIKIFKYRYVKDMAEELEPLFRKFLFKYNNLLDLEGAVLIPVPLHWHKECDRGFNQAEELAKVIGKILGLPIQNKLVFKKKSKNQAELERAERHSNLLGCFSVRGRAPKNIIIVDDVFTTGSTVRELALALKSKGAENIQVITLARG